jgi:branched-chain amino acid transport system permease protein
VVQLVWGRPAKSYQVPALLDFALFRVLGSSFPAYKAFMLLIAVAIFGFIFVILTRTRAGLIIQASLTHPQMVSMLGHNVPRVFMIVFGIGSALAALAGVIAGPVLGTFPGMAQVLGSIVFVVVVIGGLGSLTGAFVASLLIGIVQTFAVAMDVSVGGVLGAMGLRVQSGGALHDLWKITIAQIAPILPYVLLVATLILRPTGLFGTRET